jgi:formylglycine-generating enzyme required for sulfatase activity
MKKITMIALMLFFWGTTKANNIQITNVAVVPANNTIRFDVSWENSWRSSVLNNWDAAWVFFKVYSPTSRSWGTVRFTNAANNIPAGYTAAVNTLGNQGAFLYRSAIGSGTASIVNIELGIDPLWATGAYNIKGFAIEMVYIPAGAFYISDGAATNAYNFSFSHIISATTNTIDPIATPSTSISSTTFPNGYSAFYCMKYELSQGGYRDFLNTLTYTQQLPHMAALPTAAAGVPVLASGNRNFLKIKTPGVSTTTPAVVGCDADGDLIFDEANDGENIACNYLNWVDHTAYLVWAGLRPLTELEYEKAARGIQNPVAGEYAWGGLLIASTIYNLSNPNANDELVSNAGTGVIGNANFSTTYPNAPYNGPLRNGIFATATSNRQTSGGSFYGVMELSGNLLERVITTANTQGLAFNPGAGNGSINAGGYAWGSGNVGTWAGFTAATTQIDGATNALGLIYRGGSWGTGFTTLQISDRSIALITNTNTTRDANMGVRGCKTAP